MNCRNAFRLRASPARRRCQRYLAIAASMAAVAASATAGGDGARDGGAEALAQVDRGRRAGPACADTSATSSRRIRRRRPGRPRRPTARRRARRGARRRAAARAGRPRRSAHGASDRGRSRPPGLAPRAAGRCRGSAGRRRARRSVVAGRQAQAWVAHDRSLAPGPEWRHGASDRRGYDASRDRHPRAPDPDARRPQDAGERRLARPPSERYGARRRAAACRRATPADAPARVRSAAAGSRSGRSRRSSALRLIVLLGGAMAVSAGLLVVAAAIGYARRARPIVGRGGRHARRRRRGRGSPPALARSRVVVGQVGLWLFARTEGGVLPLVDYLGQTFGSLVPLQVAARRRRRLVARPVTSEARDLDGPRATSSTSPSVARPRRPSPRRRRHRRVVGRRRVRQLLPRLWLEHFSGTSWIAERPDGRLAGFLVGFLSQDDPATGYVHMIAAEPEPAAPRAGSRPCTSGPSRTSPRTGRARVRAVTWPGNRISVAFHRALGFRVDDGPGTQRAVRHAGLRRPRRPGRGSRRVHPRPVRPGTPAATGNRSAGGVVRAIRTSRLVPPWRSRPMFRRLAATPRGARAAAHARRPGLRRRLGRDRRRRPDRPNRPSRASRSSRLHGPPARRDAGRLGDRDGPLHERLDRQDHGRRRDERPTPTATSSPRPRCPRRASGAGR